MCKFLYVCVCMKARGQFWVLSSGRPVTFWMSVSSLWPKLTKQVRMTAHGREKNVIQRLSENNLEACCRNDHHFLCSFTWHRCLLFCLFFPKEYCGYINYIKEIIKMGSSLNSCSTKQYMEVKQIPSGDCMCFCMFLHVCACI